MTVQIVLDRNSVWRDIDKSAYNVPESEERLTLRISKTLFNEYVDNSVSIGDCWTLSADQSDTGTLIQALNCIRHEIDNGEWLIKTAPSMIPELVSLSEYTNYPYEQIKFRYDKWHEDNPTAYITWFIREEKQRFVFNRICRAFNEIERDHGGVIDCGELGYCRMFWRDTKWQAEWLDEIESLDDIDGDVEYKRDYVNTWH